MVVGNWAREIIYSLFWLAGLIGVERQAFTVWYGGMYG